uniref:myelin protein zero-like protein 3 n=1 Tax=Myxine glutinosa TaxID=7769 RepID=UPI00358DEE6A
MEWWMLITISTAFLLQCASLTLANNRSRNDIMNVIEGAGITIKCLFKPESEKPSLIWLWEPETGDRREIFMDLGIPVDDLDRQFSGRLSCPGNLLAGNASLVISNITKQDSGTFFCQVQKYHTTLFHSVVLNVTKSKRGVPQSPDTGQDKVSRAPLLLPFVLSGLSLPVVCIILSVIII